MMRRAGLPPPASGRFPSSAPSFILRGRRVKQSDKREGEQRVKQSDKREGEQRVKLSAKPEAEAKVEPRAKLSAKPEAEVRVALRRFAKSSMPWPTEASPRRNYANNSVVMLPEAIFWDERSARSRRGSWALAFDTKRCKPLFSRGSTPIRSTTEG